MVYIEDAGAPKVVAGRIVKDKVTQYTKNFDLSNSVVLKKIISVCFVQIHSVFHEFCDFLVSKILLIDALYFFQQQT